MVKITSWGRLKFSEHEVYSIHDRRTLPQILSQTQPGIAYGMGGSYGDACLNSGGVLWRMTDLDRFISLDETTGRLVCEAGICLGEIQRLTIPRGWTLPVTPGTQWITVGGAIANDVHGKNHHRFGTFGDHVRHLTLVRTNGDVIECSPTLQPDWFSATIGGLGLTGVVLTAEIQLSPIPGSCVVMESQPYYHIQDFFKLADAAESQWEHTVAWIDACSLQGRGIWMQANHCSEKYTICPVRSLSIPFSPPTSLFPASWLKVLNTMYFRIRQYKQGRRTLQYDHFLYPLDSIRHWNRLYGPKGFYQYQSVVPKSRAEDAIKAMLKTITQSGNSSFITVLKTFGDKLPRGLLSFTRPGVTLAMDFHNRDASTLNLFKRLDAIVQEAGGRIYLAKDARMSQVFFEASYPNVSQFLAFRDPGISSQLSRRLMGF